MSARPSTLGTTSGVRKHVGVIALAVDVVVAFVLLFHLLGPWVVAVAAATLTVVELLRWQRSSLRGEPVLTLLVGSPTELQTLRDELVFYRITRYALVGSLTPNGDTRHECALGTLADLRSVVEQQDVKLVLMSSRASRMAIFDAVAGDCPDLDLHVCDLSEFYEDTFRYTPIAVINSAWLFSNLHPGFRGPSLLLKRLFDVAFALVVGVVFLPILAVLALIIRRDGGPALFSQVRIGERGRPFKMHKLRTMGVGPIGEVWSIDGDPRVTAVGRVLRRLHLDELPQLWNILRGEMSVVGPRPEQPAIVSRLVHEFPFYHRRHMARPGLAGWAQARCGYAGSDDGVAWKLSHDLYYLKRRSLAFDLYVLLASIWKALAGNPFEEPRRTPVVVRDMSEPKGRGASVDDRSTLGLGLGKQQ
jgi:lipopolysaccharide/colanic/teichoic acid biosynthesis glycosyltransferase